MPKDEFEELLERVAERGARAALSDVGLDGENAAHDIRELRGLLEAFNTAKHTAWQTVDQAGHHRFPAGAGCGRAHQAQGVRRCPMIETLLGGLLGGAFRLAPEFLKWLDRKGERGHELAMQDKALEFEKIRGAQRMDEIGAGADAAWNVGAIETLRDAVRTQGEKTGVRWADALSSSVRPVITYWFMALYCAAKTAAFVAAVTAGAGWGVAILHAWTEADQALWAGVLNFWFLGRVFDRVRS